MTRPLSLPMTGMCHSVTARSMSRSIFSARLVIIGESSPPALSPSGGEGKSVPPLPRGERAGVRSYRRSSGGGHSRLHAVGQWIAAIPLPRLDDLTGQRAAHDLLHALRHGDERVEINPRVHSHGPETVHEILRAHVAGGARSEGTAAEPPNRRVEVGHAHHHGGQD